MVRVHLDTDIGGDIDDLCALALLLRSPDAEITGITTVTEAGGRRAGYARYALRLAGREDIPVAAGAPLPQGTLPWRIEFPDEAAYWPEPVPPAPGEVAQALALLAASIERGATIVAIGPFTNLALLEQRSPGILAHARVVLMGGHPRRTRAGFPPWGYREDYNVQVDVAASAQVFAACDPLVVPISATVETALRRAHLARLRRSGPLGALIARQAEAHDLEHQNSVRLVPQHPALPADLINFQHDPLAVAVALGWDVVTIERLPLRFGVEDGWLRMDERRGSRPTEVVTAVDGPRFNELWVQHVAGTPARA
ncbi:MAG TPA: nucleoside hydrolase [Dehalococcoidia bacterium]|jgi:purine nucleosidase|nr:nucleoside hydrolase [Dehalococcoidia bacterium]